MGDYIITSDNMGDLPESYLRDNEVRTMSLTYLIDGESYDEEHPLPYKEFYAKMRNGSMPTTSQVNPEQAREKLLEYLKVSKNIIHIAFSSGLSGTYSSVSVAAREIMEENPDCRITVIDSSVRLPERDFWCTKHWNGREKA